MQPNIAAFHDQFNLVSKLSGRKVMNSAKILGSYFISKWSKNAFHSGLPMSIAIEPTTSCNLRCPECPSGLRSFSRPTGMLQNKLFKNLIDELYPYLQYLTFYFQGEPYLNKGFLEMVNYASAKNIYTATSTNGHYLNKENSLKTVKSGLDRLIISIDGTTQETYSAYRKGGNLEKVIQGAKNIVEAKNQLQSRKPYTIFQFLVVRPNEHQIEEVQSLATQIGIDKVKFKTAQIYNYKFGSGLMPENEKYSRYKANDDGTFSIKNKLLNHCWKMWHSCVITWDGSVVPCCFDKDATHSFGNVSEDGFMKIWTGSRYKNFREAILRSRKEIDICANCSEGTRVWA